MIFEGIEQFRASGFRPRIGIVGAGPAGISIAHKLGIAKIPSVIFEAGGRDYSDESQDFYKGKVTGDPYFDLDVTRLRYLGGSSNHWAGWCRVFDAHDFLPKPYVPHSGWPITRAAIEPFLPEAFDILGIAPFEPDVPISSEMRWFEMIKSDHVHFGEKFMPELDGNPNVAIVLDTEVSELIGNGHLVTGAKLWSQGAPAGEIALDYFVVCTGGLENSRLLLWSNERSNGGVVPNAAALGRYWMEHPMYTAGDAIINGEISGTIMRWQDETQAYDEAVGERVGLNAAERRCLGLLHEGPRSAGAIATATGLTPAAVTALVDRLEARGLLTRKRSDEDRRKVIIEATAKAAEMGERYYGSIAREGVGMLASFDEAELATILRFMKAALELQRRQLQTLKAEPAGAQTCLG